MTGDSPRLRMSVLGIVVFSLFAALFARLWYLQVMVSDEFQVAAESNRVRVVAVEAPRGRILDRDGTVLVDNRVSIQVMIDRAEIRGLSTEDRQSMLEHLAAGLTRAGRPTTVEELEERVADARYSPYVPVPVAADVSEELKIWIDERGDELPSVSAERVAIRTYPYGRLAAHVLGYVGRISEEEFDERREAPKPYSLNDTIGKAGVERVYEPELRGMPGERRIEVDAHGTPVRVIHEEPPIPGNDVVLTLDIDIQAVTERALQQGLERTRSQGRPAPAGSAVVVDPRDGGVWAMASYPDFDPTGFIGGINSMQWAYYNDPANRFPLNNWAIMGQYPPGSTFKPFTAYAALRSGLITPDTPYQDTGSYQVTNCQGPGCSVRNSGRRSHGTIDLRRALTVSSNAYFAQLGARAWIERGALGSDEAMQEGLREFGVGTAMNLDLPGERPGRVPSGAWKQEFCTQVACADDGWYTGDNINMSIGQGDVLMTPLQLASGYATIGNGGTRWQPRIADRILHGVTGEVVQRFEPTELGRVEMPPEWRQAIVDGLIGVTQADGGTATSTFASFPNEWWPVAGKTGTAQVSNRTDHAEFAAFGPAYDPQYALAVVMEESGFGGVAAAPVARQIFDVLAGVIEVPPAPMGGRFDENDIPDETAPVAGVAD